MLRQSTVSLEDNTLEIRRATTKSDAGKRTLALTPESRQILGRRLDGKSCWVFPSHRRVWHRKRQEFYTVTIPARHFSYSGLIGQHNAVCEATGLDFNPYSLRHTFATRFYRKTKNLDALRKILGHKDIKTTMRYVHTDQDDLRLAMEEFSGSLNWKPEQVN